MCSENTKKTSVATAKTIKEKIVRQSEMSKEVGRGQTGDGLIRTLCFTISELEAFGGFEQNGYTI